MADTLVDLGGGVYQANNGKPESTYFGENANGGNSLPYSDIELYLMGLTDKTQVAPIKVATDPEWVDIYSGKFSASGMVEYTIDDIIREHGARVPSVADSQKAFRALVVMLTPRPLEDREWAQVDGHVVDFSLAANDGNPGNYNFWEATRGLATMTMDDIDHFRIIPLACNFNSDAVVDLRDAIIVLKLMAGMTPATPVSQADDVSGDGKIGLAEALCAMRAAAGAEAVSGR